jgi:hypothetical protein
MQNKTYECEKCQFKTNISQAYEKHLETVKHKTGKNKTRCDKKLIDVCPDCGYTTKSNMSMTQHILNKHSTIKERKEKFKYYCELCDFGEFRQGTFNNHLSQSRHQRMINKE